MADATAEWALSMAPASLVEALAKARKDLLDLQVCVQDAYAHFVRVGQQAVALRPQKQEPDVQGTTPLSMPEFDTFKFRDHLKWHLPRRLQFQGLHHLIPPFF